MTGNKESTKLGLNIGFGCALPVQANLSYRVFHNPGSNGILLYRPRLSTTPGRAGSTAHARTLYRRVSPFINRILLLEITPAGTKINAHHYIATKKINCWVFIIIALHCGYSPLSVHQPSCQGAR